MSLQKTKFEALLSRTADYLFEVLLGPWRRVSVGIISLLFGYYLGSTVTASLLEGIGTRPIAVILTVLVIEVLIRLRSLVSTESWPIQWLSIDNLRIGAVYALVLEAFKLGS